MNAARSLIATGPLPQASQRRRSAWAAVIASLTLGAGLSPAAPARAAGSEALDSLLAAERAFSALSVQKGIKPAFIAYLAPDAIVFRPTATNGPKAIEGQLPSTNILTWEPSYAEISAAGDLGVTSGPWELLRADPTRPPIGYGHFISVWRKERGQWRVAVDIGTEHDKPERGVGSGDFTPGPKPVHGPKSSSVDLGVLDDTFTKTMMTRGIGAAYAAMGAADLRFHRDNIMPLVGLSDVRALLEKTPGYYGYRTEGQRIASSHDLGCTWGQAAQHPPGGTVSPADSCVYLHVWRRGDDRQWKLALEVLNPLVRRR